MHMEIDALEIVFILFAFQLFKWLFRALLLIVIGKAISTLKNKVGASVNDLKTKVNEFERSKSDSKNDNEEHL